MHTYQALQVLVGPHLIEFPERPHPLKMHELIGGVHIPDRLHRPLHPCSHLPALP